MIVLGNGVGEIGRQAVPGKEVLVAAFLAAPAEIDTTRGRGRLIVDLLPQILAHIADVEIAVGPVKAKAPWVAQADGPNLVPAVAAHVGVIRRDGIGRRAVYVQPQHRSQQGGRILAMVQRIAAAAAVAHADI